MELSRRDAAAALAALGIGGSAVGATVLDQHVPDEGATTAEIRETMIATAEIVYPATVSGIDEFVESFLAGRLDRADHAKGLSETVAELNELAVEWHDDRVPALDDSTREEFLREVGADVADEVPDGTTAERVRYYVVNDLLLALYTSPTGGKLVGIENPQGHPGGTATYQRGPEG
jgi:hypothetical protein